MSNRNRAVYAECLQCSWKGSTWFTTLYHTTTTGHAVTYEKPRELRRPMGVPSLPKPKKRSSRAQKSRTLAALVIIVAIPAVWYNWDALGVILQVSGISFFTAWAIVAGSVASWKKVVELGAVR